MNNLDSLVNKYNTVGGELQSLLLKIRKLVAPFLINHFF